MNKAVTTKSFHGWKSEIMLDHPNGVNALSVVAMKRFSGNLVVTANGGTVSKFGGGTQMFSIAPYTDYSKQIADLGKVRVTEKLISGCLQNLESEIQKTFQEFVRFYGNESEKV